MSAKFSSSTGLPLNKIIPIAAIAVVVLVAAYVLLAGGSKAPAPTTAAPNAPACSGSIGIRPCSRTH